MEKKIKTISFSEAVRKRPGMYLGSNDGKGILNLIFDLLADCIKIYNNRKILVTIELEKKDWISLRIPSVDGSLIVELIRESDYVKQSFNLRILKALTSKLEIVKGKSRKEGLHLRFIFDKKIFRSRHIDYFKLMDKVSQLALLNPGFRVMIKDKTKMQYSQNYFCFPEGIKYIYELAKEEGWSILEHSLSYTGRQGINEYKVYLGYRFDQNSEPFIQSFANNIHTTRGGSLVKGVLSGLSLAFKNYIQNNNLTNYRVSKKELWGGLVLVCSAGGGDYNYAGSTKEALEDKNVEKEVKKICFNIATNFLESDEIRAKKFMERFCLNPWSPLLN